MKVNTTTYYPSCVTSAGLESDYDELVRMFQVAGRLQARGDVERMRKADARCRRLLRDFKHAVVAANGGHWTDFSLIDDDLRGVRTLADLTFDQWEQDHSRRNAG